MNYLAEINAFERRMRRQPLPATAQLLWYKLMHFANRLYWPEWFSIDNDRLTEIMCACSDKTIRLARELLIKESYIEYKRGVKGRPSQYHMISLVEMEADQRREAAGITIYEPEGVEAYSEDVDNIKLDFAYNEDAHSEAEKTAGELFKLYLPGRRPDAQDVARVYRAITVKEGELYQVNRDRKELLAYAFEQASLANAMNWNYINGILANLHRRGIKTRDQAYDYDMERKGWQ